MKARNITAVVFGAMLIFNSAIAQKKDGFVLDCNVSGLKDGTKASAPLLKVAGTSEAYNNLTERAKNRCECKLRPYHKS